MTRCTRRGFIGRAVFLPGILSATARADESQFDPHRFDDRWAVVYAGPSAGRGCPEGVARIAREIGLEVKYFKNVKRLPRLLDRASVLIVGGTTGDIDELRNVFNAELTLALRAYLKRGGRYWGVCGGAYIASQRYQGYHGRVEALQLIPAAAEDYSSATRAKLIPVRWRGVTRDLYALGSPSFRILDADAPVDIVATFHDGPIAALICAYGQGKVAVSGPHPEATTTWLQEDGLETDNWKPTRPLAHALLKDLLSERPIDRRNNH